MKKNRKKANQSKRLEDLAQEIKRREAAGTHDQQSKEWANKRINDILKNR